MNIDTTSATWRVIKAHVEKELQRQREDLEYVTISENRANQCRGAILQLKTLLNLPASLTGIDP